MWYKCGTDKLIADILTLCHRVINAIINCAFRHKRNNSLQREEQAHKSPPIPLALFSCNKKSAREHPSPTARTPSICYRPFSHHWTLERSLFVGFNRNDVSLLHLVERGCCGYTIAEVICACGSLVAYVCYPQLILSSIRSLRY